MNLPIDKNKYPYSPPYDDEVTFYEGATVRVNLSDSASPSGQEQESQDLPHLQLPNQHSGGKLPLPALLLFRVPSEAYL